MGVPPLSQLLKVGVRQREQRGLRAGKKSGPAKQKQLNGIANQHIWLHRPRRIKRKEVEDCLQGQHCQHHFPSSRKADPSLIDSASP